MASFDDFKKLELRVAVVRAAERVPDSDKLVKLTLDDGAPEGRQVVAGIGTAYEPEGLVGKRIVIVANLEPRVLMGLESNGMLLAAHDADGRPILLVPEGEVPPGSPVS